MGDGLRECSGCIGALTGPGGGWVNPQSNNRRELRARRWRRERSPELLRVEQRHLPLPSCKGGILHPGTTRLGAKSPKGGWAVASRLVAPLAFFLSVFLVLSDWVGSPVPLLAQSSDGSPGDGLQFHILSTRIDDTRRPVVTYQITDDAGHPLSPADLDGSPRFTLVRLHVDEETGLLSEWVSYIVSTV